MRLHWAWFFTAATWLTAERVRAKWSTECELGRPGVIGNTDEMLARPETLADFLAQSPPTLQPLFAVISENAAAAREALGEDRVAWLGRLPQAQIQEQIAPGPEATDAELEIIYRPLGKTFARTFIACTFGGFRD